MPGASSNVPLRRGGTDLPACLPPCRTVNQSDVSPLTRTAPCVVLSLGAREHQGGDEWGAYAVDEAALRHSAGVEKETTDEEEAYGRFPESEPTRYRDGWLD